MSTSLSRPSPKQIIAQINLKAIRKQDEAKEIFESYTSTPTPEEHESEIFESYASFDEDDYYSSDKHKAVMNAQPRPPTQQSAFQIIGHQLKQNLALPFPSLSGNRGSRSRSKNSAFERSKTSLDRKTAQSPSIDAVNAEAACRHDDAGFVFGQRTRAHPSPPPRQSSAASLVLKQTSRPVGQDQQQQSGVVKTENKDYLLQIAAHK
ncbi:UNVERIFIED_CONTAM: hypothetical protein HDU68_007478 [Siphonaria sp. JEL0065]|nr:hypothetical protein HDU68_007478 [Siphonaria sp. JEL0065]